MNGVSALLASFLALLKHQHAAAVLGQPGKLNLFASLKKRIARKKSLWLQLVRGVGMNFSHDKVLVAGNCRTGLHE